jgi:hypothetical protein
MDLNGRIMERHLLVAYPQNGQGHGSNGTDSCLDAVLERTGSIRSSVLDDIVYAGG